MEVAFSLASNQQSTEWHLAGFG